MFDRAWNWLARRSATDHLRRMDDRMLADMGLERGLIEQSVARGVKLRAGMEAAGDDREGPLPSECGPRLAHYAATGR